MAFQTVFKRYELKYLLTAEQKQKILRAIDSYMLPDEYGRTVICNLYYDTDDYLLIRRSLEKPVYKEKLRVRSYGRATPDSTVFVELKKKYKSVVYKRRISLTQTGAISWLDGEAPCPKDTQISREIDYFLRLYGTLHPTVFLSYERQAFYGKDQPDFRVTFDENILCRQTDLTLTGKPTGAPILPEGLTLMEIKCAGGIPLWMTGILTEEHLYKTTFSKYGTAYRTMILPRMMAARTKTNGGNYT